VTIRAIDLQRLVNLYGEPLTLQSYTEGVYNPAEGTSAKTPNAPVTLIGYNAMYDLGEVDGSNVIRGDRKVIFGNRDTSGNPIDPQVDDEIIGVGDRVTVISVHKIKSREKVLCYICQVRE
jgi:hypothetical protein